MRGTPTSLQAQKLTRARRRLGARELWWWTPLLFAAAYLVTLAVQLNELLANTYLNADVASAPVIGELFGERTGDSPVILGHLGWFSSLVFELATRWMPFHRQIWEGAPYGMALISAALIGWGAWRVAGRWAGAIALAIVICAGPAALSLLLALNNHAPTWFTLALLGAFVVLLEQPAQLSGAWTGAAAIVVGVVLGVNAASDTLLTIVGAAPLVFAVGSTWAIVRSRQTARAAATVVVSCAVALASGLVVHAIARHQHVVSASDPKTKLFASADAVGTNFKLWWQSIAVLGNGDFFGQTIGFSTALALLCAILSVAGVFLAGGIARGEVIGEVAVRDQRDVGANARLAWCLFWSSSLLVLSAAFIFSGVTEKGSNRYLLGAIYAVAALLPLLGRRGPIARAALVGAVTVYAFSGWLALAQRRIKPPSSPSYMLASAVQRLAIQEHLSVGYAGYWDAAPITWATHMHVKVFPVDDCEGNQHLCAFELHLITSWYTPRRGVKTFLLSDPAYPAVPSAPTPDLGPPVAVHQIGAVTMYVFPYDIASRLYAL